MNIYIDTSLAFPHPNFLSLSTIYIPLGVAWASVRTPRLLILACSCRLPTRDKASQGSPWAGPRQKQLSCQHMHGYLHYEVLSYMNTSTMKHCHVKTVTYMNTSIQPCCLHPCAHTNMRTRIHTYIHAYLQHTHTATHTATQCTTIHKLAFPFRGLINKLVFLKEFSILIF